MTVSAVIPSYRRPESLIRCLAAIDRQTQPPDEVVVVCRDSDIQSLHLVKERWMKADHPYQACVAVVDVPGQIAALRQGVETAFGDIVVFTDDDTVPHPDWIERLIQYYSDPMVGAVGGRDILNGHTETPSARRVGVITWYGKMIGNHHLGSDRVSEVAILKGANASFRRQLVTLPDFFKGEGAEVHNEVYMCLCVRQLGYKIIYDPQICVDHFPAVRFDEDQRDESNPTAIRNAAFNISVTFCLLAPWRKALSMFLFNVLVGQRGGPGLLRLLAAVCRWETDVVLSYVPAQFGQLAGIAHYFRWKRKVKTVKSKSLFLKQNKSID